MLWDVQKTEIQHSFSRSFFSFRNERCPRRKGEFLPVLYYPKVWIGKRRIVRPRSSPPSSDEVTRTNLSIPQVLLEQLLPSTSVVQKVEVHLLRDLRVPRLEGVKMVPWVLEPEPPEVSDREWDHQKIWRTLEQRIEKLRETKKIGYRKTSPYLFPFFKSSVYVEFCET